MRKKDIQSREDAITKDMVAESNTRRQFRFPKLGVTVEAKTYDEALSKAKKQLTNK